MTFQDPLPEGAPDPRLVSVIKLGIFAVGGQGGGVLTNWIEATARRSGFTCQATSVAGVAQRTGSTIYYLELAPAELGHPVLALAPSAGDVDVLIASELMEAGRAIQRGFVTPDRTTLIASRHRALAVSEKTVPGNGIASAEEVEAAAEIAARRLVVFDIEAVAVAAGSVISASLLGALAGSGALPFARVDYEAAIRASGKGVEGSLAAFAAAFDMAGRGEAPAPAAPAARAPAEVSGPAALLSEWSVLAARAGDLPAPVAEMALPGLRKVVQFQDISYGRDYLDRLDAILACDTAAHGFLLTREAAKYVANAMAYDDIIRVADEKTRAERFTRIRAEMQADDTRLMQLTEYFHPRAEEVVGLLPAGLGRRLSRSPRGMRVIGRLAGGGRRLRSDGVWAFSVLYLLAGLKGWRRRSLRHAEEVAHMEAWLATAMAHVDRNYDLAVELIRTRRLVKGYSDTHARGVSKFDRVLAGTALVAGREDAADWCRRLREAALADEKGAALDGAIETIRSFADSGRQA